MMEGRGRSDDREGARRGGRAHRGGAVSQGRRSQGRRSLMHASKSGVTLVVGEDEELGEGSGFLPLARLVGVSADDEDGFEEVVVEVVDAAGGVVLDAVDVRAVGVLRVGDDDAPVALRGRPAGPAPGAEREARERRPGRRRQDRHDALDRSRLAVDELHRKGAVAAHGPQRVRLAVVPPRLEKRRRLPRSVVQRFHRRVPRRRLYRQSHRRRRRRPVAPHSLEVRHPLSEVLLPSFALLRRRRVRAWWLRRQRRDRRGRRRRRSWFLRGRRRRRRRLRLLLRGRRIVLRGDGACPLLLRRRRRCCRVAALLPGSSSSSRGGPRLGLLRRRRLARRRRVRGGGRQRHRRDDLRRRRRGRRPLLGSRHGSSRRRRPPTEEGVVVALTVVRRRRRALRHVILLDDRREASVVAVEGLGEAEPLVAARFDADALAVFAVAGDGGREEVVEPLVQPLHGARVDVFLPVGPVLLPVVAQQDLAARDVAHGAHVDAPRRRVSGVHERLDVLDVLPLREPRRRAIFGAARVVHVRHQRALQHRPQLRAKRLVPVVLLLLVR
mmetsp:Transcript_17240/g.52411  ORF Transcript_17240/g.52411 Transcript_17240/m.52411 type:complete len:554 (-) Transcript_17240:673-2334(-)